MQIKVSNKWIDSPLQGNDPVEIALLAQEQGYREIRIICKEKDAPKNKKNCCGK